MPDTALTNASILSTNQFMVRPATLGGVLNYTPPPANQPQPLGNTPVWCATTPTGSNDQIFHRSSDNQAFYFPSFAVDTDDAGKPKVKFTQPNKPRIDTLLTIALAPLPPTAAQTANAGGASLVPCPAALYADAANRDTTVVVLAYNDGRRLTFDSVTPTASGGLTCVLTMTKDSTIGEVMGTLVNSDGDVSKHASIVVTRTIAALGVVAGTAPVGTPPPPQWGANPPGSPGWLAQRQALMHQSVVMTRPEMFIPRPWPMPPHPFPPPVPPPPPTPVTLYTLLTNQPVASVVPDVWFNENLDSDIIGDVKNVTPMQAGYLEVTVPGFDNPLFQDANDDTTYYYLPDAFKIPRRDTPPFLPTLNVMISGTTMNDAQATVFLTALPVIDARKLQAARDQLQKGNRSAVTLQALPTPKNITYGLYLPGPNPFVTRAVPVQLDQPLLDSPQLSLADFQTAFASLTGNRSEYLQGKITVPVGDNIANVPLVVHQDNFPGEYFQQTRSVDPAGTSIALVLVNAIESAVEVDALPIVATRAGVPVACVTTYDPPLPATLAAIDDDHPTAGSLTVTVTPASGPIDQTLQIAVDESQCHVVVDAPALLRAVLDPNVPVTASTPVTVAVPAAFFKANPDPAKQIAVIAMTFQNGNTIKFQAPADPNVTPTTMIASDRPGQVDMTVSEYILRSSAGDIKYKLRITHADGHSTDDADWQTAPNDDFILDLP